MSGSLQAEPKAAPAPSLTPARTALVQRKCACGGAPAMTGDCEECGGKKRLALQRYSANRAETSTLWRSLAAPSHADALAAIAPGFGHSFAQLQAHNRAPHRVQTKLTVSRPGDQYEQEADRIAEQVTRSSAPSGSEANQHSTALSRIQPLIQRQANDETAASPEIAETAAPETSPPDQTAAAVLIVEDEAQEVGPGQMRKSEFLDELRAAACAAADAELARVGRSTESCPYIERAFERYRRLSSNQLERGLRRYAPEAAGSTTARGYIPAVSERVRQAVAVWATTGQITGVPEELASELPGAGLLDAVGGFFSGVAGAVSGVIGGVGRALGGIFTKAREGGAKEAGDLHAIQAQLGSGQPLDGGVRSRMETAFGYNFSQVRVHTDAQAAALSSRLNARAFTIGGNIAFGAGEYRPGALIGDALLAHELAHVVQQGGAISSERPLQMGDTESTALEEDADASAINVVMSLWNGARGKTAIIAQDAMPRLKAGLGLHRCGATRSQQRPPTAVPTVPTPPPQSPSSVWVEEAGGEAGCDTTQGRVVWQVTLPSGQSCLQPCAYAHEAAHERFMRDQCTRVSAAIQRAEQAIQTARTAQTQEALEAAQAAAAEARTVGDSYMSWLAQTCAENERQAYQATIDVCGTPEAEQRCRSVGQEEAYRQNLELWHRYLTTPPPNCPSP